MSGLSIVALIVCVIAPADIRVIASNGTQ